jgi:hypothetical protein
LESMTYRERVLRTLRFQPVDRVPDNEFGLWEQTLTRWRQEGMEYTPNALSGPLQSFYGTDEDEPHVELPLINYMLPGFEWTVLEEREQTRIIRDCDGAISEQLKPEYGASIPHYLRYALESRADWQRIRDERLNPAQPGRLPRHVDALARRLRVRTHPFWLGCGSLYGWVRGWMGVQRLSLMVYDDRPLVEEIMEHVTQLTLGLMEQLANKGLEVDNGVWWEDMCYNHGSLLSPRLFSELMVPRYKRITGFMREAFGTEFHILDSDGNIHELAPLWLEGGINVMFPLEVAHTDAYRLSSQFGTRMALRGGFDKRALIAGPAAIDAEFERLRPLFLRGGFIPMVDHVVPPDVSLANCTYYRRKKCEFIGKPWSEPGVRHWPGYLTEWWLLGPFDRQQEPTIPAPAALEGPEAAPFRGKGGATLAWRGYCEMSASGYVDLAAALSPEPECVAYAACDVDVPTAREAWLELGSTDNLQVWVNGAEVLRCDAQRGAALNQDIVPAQLRAGRNRLLLRSGRAQGAWGFYCRLTDDQSRCWPDVRVSKEPIRWRA